MSTVVSPYDIIGYNVMTAFQVTFLWYSRENKTNNLFAKVLHAANITTYKSHKLTLPITNSDAL